MADLRTVQERRLFHLRIRHPPRSQGESITLGVTQTDSQGRRGQADVDIHPRMFDSFTPDIATSRCTYVAADAVRVYVDDQFDDTAGLGVSLGRSPTRSQNPK